MARVPTIDECRELAYSLWPIERMAFDQLLATGPWPIRHRLEKPVDPEDVARMARRWTLFVESLPLHRS